MTCTLSTLALFLAGLLFAPEGEMSARAAESAGAEGAAEETFPEFKSEQGKEYFDQALQLYRAKDYKKARTGMRKLKNYVSGTKNRVLLDQWVRACEGGVYIEAYKKMAERGAVRKTLSQVMNTSIRYRDTPINKEFEKLTDELLSKAAVVLEDFDAYSNRYSKKFGKEFVKDPKIVFKGKYSLLWKSIKGKAAQLRLPEDKAPKNWNQFHSVMFWIYPIKPVEMELVALSATQKKGQESSGMVYKYKPSSSRGWVRVEVELSKFKKHGAGSFSSVGLFLFQIEAKTSYQFCLDQIMLIRKDPSEMRASGS